MDINLAMANKITEELKKLQAFIEEKEAQLAESSKFTQKKLYEYEIHLEDQLFEIECHSLQLVPHDDEYSNHLICIKDDAVIAEFWGVQAWIRKNSE